MTHALETGSSAAGVAWDLGDLYRGLDDPRLNTDLEGAMQRARLFEKNYRGRIDTPGGPSAEQLLAAVTELESLYEQLDRPSVLAGLLHAAKSDDPAHGALLSRTREHRAAVNKHLIFF